MRGTCVSKGLQPVESVESTDAKVRPARGSGDGRTSDEHAMSFCEGNVTVGRQGRARYGQERKIGRGRWPLRIFA